MNDEAIRLQIQKHMPKRPSHFYKYRSGSEKDICTLKQRKIWVPTFQKLNDIFENDFEFEEKIALGKANIRYPIVLIDPAGEPYYAPIAVYSYLEGDELKKHQAKVKSDIHSFREAIFNMGVYSLATAGDVMSMWSYYADSHKGYCIKYKPPSNDNINLLCPRPRFVIYQNSPPKIDWSLMQHYSPEMLKCNMLFHKPENFTWENEYRALFEIGDQPYDIPYQIESIIFGERAEDDLKDQIYKIFLNEVKYEKFEKVKGTYNLRTVEDEYCKIKLKSLT